MSSISLLGATSRVEVPFIKVTIGDFTFGVYNKVAARVKDENGFYQAAKITYPNYITSLNIVKINGEVNQYTLSFSYPITPGDDPNFFEKVFSSVSKTRKITFSYGDVNLPQFIYKDEVAIITSVTCNFPQQGGAIGSVLNYTVKATSSCKLTYANSYNWPKYHGKPSDKIKEILYNNKFGLLDVFYGMTNPTQVDSLGLIASNDKEVDVDAPKSSLSALEYIKYLCSFMTMKGAPKEQLKQDFYILTIHDEINGLTNSDTVNAASEYLGGPYFKVSRVSKNINYSEAYEIDIGFPTSNVILSFQINNNENYSLYYNWDKKINDKEYIYRLNDDGDFESIWSPSIFGGDIGYEPSERDKTWWAKVVQYPITATITLKGLIRPATLMEYVRLNILFYGAKHIHSGLYIVTSQTDDISTNGFRTTLNLTRVQGTDMEV